MNLYLEKFNTIPGSGKDGRVLKEDILAFVNLQTSGEKLRQTTTTAIPPSSAKIEKNALQQQQPPAVAVKPTEPVPVRIKKPQIILSPGQDRTEPVKGITKAMVKSMSEALKIPHFGYKDEIDMSALVQLRKELKNLAESQGVKLSYMPVILKACSLALDQYPILNAYFDANAETITYKADHNIGKRNNHNRLRNNMTSLLSKYTKTASDQIINTSCTISHNFCNQINDFFKQNGLVFIIEAKIS